MKFVVQNEDDLQPVAGYLVSVVPSVKIFTFSGQLGAGKTTLIKIFCRLLGVHENVSSPTFSLVNEYEGEKNTIYHFDFYRLKNETEAFDIGFEEYLDSGHICLIEWPERVEQLLPAKYSAITITVLETGERIIEIIN